MFQWTRLGIRLEKRPALPYVNLNGLCLEYGFYAGYRNSYQGYTNQFLSFL